MNWVGPSGVGSGDLEDGPDTFRVDSTVVQTRRSPIRQTARVFCYWDVVTVINAA